MRRFIIDKNLVSDGEAIISGNLFRHMAKVLRLKIGTRVKLVDEMGIGYTGLIREIGRENLIVAIEQAVPEATAAAGPRIILLQGLPKGDKMEFILQKGTELGVAEIIPFVAGRSVPKIAKDREDDKLVRWQRIAREAARQCNRTTVPDISQITDFSNVVVSATQSIKLLLWEKEQANGLKQVLSELSVPDTIAVMVGPEGGLTPDEADAAIEAGFIPVTLGHRILRTETAAIAILAILQFFWGDLG